jgi:hypothetical protein
MALLLAFYLIFSAVIPASALEGSPAAAALVIKADVLYWEERGARGQRILRSRGASCWSPLKPKSKAWWVGA